MIFAAFAPNPAALAHSTQLLWAQIPSPFPCWIVHYCRWRSDIASVAPMGGAVTNPPASMAELAFNPGLESPFVRISRKLMVCLDWGLGGATRKGLLARCPVIRPQPCLSRQLHRGRKAHEQAVLGLRHLVGT